MTSDPLAVLRELVEAATEATDEGTAYLPRGGRLDTAIWAARAVLDSAQDMGAMGTFGGVVLTLIAFKERR